MFQNYVFSFYDTLAEVKLDLESQTLWEKLSVYCGIFDYHLEADSLRQKFFAELAHSQQKNIDTPYYEANYEDILLRLFQAKKLKGKNKTPKDMGRFFHLLAAQELILLPQVKKTLEQLKKQDKNLFLLVNGQKAFVKDELRYFGIKDYFDVVYVSSDYSVRKPSVAFFNQMINENKLEKKKTLFVGADFETDLLPAKKLGYFTCLVLKQEKSAQHTEQADFILENREIKKILDF